MVRPYPLPPNIGPAAAKTCYTQGDSFNLPSEFGNLAAVSFEQRVVDCSMIDITCGVSYWELPSL